MADRDWDAVASLCADDLVEHDNRSLAVFGVTRGVEPWIQLTRTVSDLAPDSVFRVHHFIPGARGHYAHGGFHGTRDGGPFEIAMNILVEIDGAGLIARVDTYDDDRVCAASRWAELGIPAPSTARESAQDDDPRPPVAKPNAASAWLHRFQSVINARDWDGVRALYASQPTYEDRQRLALISGGMDMLLASLRERAAAGARLERIELLGTAGSRIAIQRLLWAGGGREDRFEMEHLVVLEVDEAERLVATINFDLVDARAAQREAWARWAAIDPVAAPWVALLNAVTDAWNAHDVAKVRACFADDVTVEDHRLAGLGRIEGADRYMDSFVAPRALASDQRLEFADSCAIDQHGAVFTARRAGTLEAGGAFENEYAWLALARDGRIMRLELFEIGKLDAALARFAELGAARTT